MIEFDVGRKKVLINENAIIGACRMPEGRLRISLVADMTLLAGKGHRSFVLDMTLKEFRAKMEGKKK